MMEKLRANIRRFREIGVGVYITELFIPTDNFPGTMEEKLVLQASIYADIHRIGAEEGIGITIFRPNSGTLPQYAYPPPEENALPYPRDQNYKPLPSYYAINAAILSTMMRPSLSTGAITPTPTP